MIQSFLVEDDGSVSINGAEVLQSQMVLAGAGAGLPQDWGDRQREKADLLERRLSRLESALGLNPICAD
jgi:hypothetical protein